MRGIIASSSTKSYHRGMKPFPLITPFAALFMLFLGCRGHSDPKSSKMAKQIESINALAGEAITTHLFPGCSIEVLHLNPQGNSKLFEFFLGHESYASNSHKIRFDTRYDLASLTKVIATTGVAMALHSQGKLNLDTPINKLIPPFYGPQKNKVNLRHLLTHSSGLPAWKPFYKTLKGKDAFKAAICKTPLEAEPGTRYRYSDLGMILLGFCLEKIGRDSLDQLAKKLVFDPLGMKHTSFGPLPLEITAIAATENVPERGGVLRGVVHDENANAMGGVAGHAGLFSTGGDILQYLQCLLEKGQWKGKQVFSEKSIQLFTHRANLLHGSSRALGFDTAHPGSIAGRFASKETIIHTGFTGTSILVDFQKRKAVVCLSNRVHPSRKRKGIRRFRIKLHEIVEGP
jgi:CubicO group peptidase (beta-lactamase class C family)